MFDLFTGVLGAASAATTTIDATTAALGAAADSTEVAAQAGEWSTTTKVLVTAGATVGGLAILGSMAEKDYEKRRAEYRAEVYRRDAEAARETARLEKIGRETDRKKSAAWAAGW